ncbi:conserved hypothetical protein [Xanthomonas citri pv. fuscans]|uniref:hypothetical protein n=1 Tax=Xanthomonas TaxID=338 RepID=UPI000C17C88E|nr:hypothetical protein [Xanthomonas citri]ATS51230.1 hypothetical protein XcfCFBP6992P_10225 [Xanthomonas citri pv. phaseoli var. fuscans]ATS56962.1 hypothetical protein XcfCFBP6994P_18940 [Xanthomonas citri pv. phaseoli var. fuscans]QWN15837.1 hypothetical protein DGN02_08215 [Xanthomonas citri]SOO21388.1 conserved hypothetical protein [Xanthomonas citri pv. fuscans]SOO35470.1 Hydroxyproline-rich glycoprotein DZ-HRGP [Xanthomonas citri pv. fuscans]
MRELTNEELFLVAGAAAAADVDPSEPPTELPPVVVNPPPSEPPTLPPSPPVEQPSPPPQGGGGSSPSPIVSGLGTGVDEYINKSDAVKNLLAQYVASDRHPAFKDLGAVKGDVENGQIFIDDNYAGTTLEAATILSHELYHVYNPVDYGTPNPSEEQYVNTWLNNEAGSLVFELNFVNQVEPTTLSQYPAEVTSIYNQIGSTLTQEQAMSQLATWYGNQDHGGGQTVRQYYESVYNGN